jgi:uncharacterized SAM-binding protein YcdF (DUF218 family)
MLFTLSKVLTALFIPSALAVLAVASGVWLLVRGTRRRLATRLAVGGLAFLAIAGIVPVGNAIILPLEQRFAAVPAPGSDEKIAGIIILGGFEDGLVSAAHGALAVNESAERLTQGLRLALKYPEARIVFTSGVGGLWPGGVDATRPLAAFFNDVGVTTSRLVLEGKARNTQENADFIARMLGSDTGGRWVLVTSAYHMPRAVGIFRKTGFDVIPYPVDYRTRGPEDLGRLFESIPAGLQRTDLAVKEWVGLIAYRLMGRIDSVFPAP